MEIEGDYVVRIALGRRNMALITKFGQVWICGNYQKPKHIMKEDAETKDNSSDSDKFMDDKALRKAERKR